MYISIEILVWSVILDHFRINQPRYIHYSITMYQYTQVYILNVFERNKL